MQKNSSIMNSVVFSEINLIRNIQNYPFSGTLDDNTKLKLENEIINHINSFNNNNSLIDLSLISNDDIDFYKSKNMINEDFYNKKKGRFIIFNDGKENLSIILNSNDHINITVTCPDLYNFTVYKSVEKLEEKIGKKFSFAVSGKYGFLTSYVKNCGLGLKITILTHLAGLKLSKRFEEISDMFNSHGYTLEPYNFEESEKETNYYYVSSKLNYGVSESNLINRFTEGLKQLLEINQKELLDYYRKHTLDIMDKIYRSYGILKYAKILSYEETFEHITNLRIGLEMGEKIELKKEKLNELFLNIKDNSIKKLKECDSKNINTERAEIVKEFLF